MLLGLLDGTGVPTMGDAPKDERKYDTAKLRTLQKDLGRLNEAFLPGPGRGRRAPAERAPSDEAAAEAVTVAKTRPAVKAKAKPGTPKKKPGTAKSKAAKPKSGPPKGAKARKAPPAARSKRAAVAAEAGAAPARPAVAAADKGKAGARRLLAMLGRIDGDDSPLVPGTDFTEAGVVRLLAHLRRRKSQSFRFLRRLLRVLTRPAALGMRTSAGVSVERLQLVGRQLEEIEVHGWDHFQSRRVARRGRQALPFAPTAVTSDAPATEV